MNSAAVDVASKTPMSPLPKVGTLGPDCLFQRSDDVSLGRQTGGQFATLEDALVGAATLSQQSGERAYAVSRRGDSFVASELLQPVWTTNIMRKEASGYDNVKLIPLTATDIPVEPTFAFYEYQQDKRGNRKDIQRTGDFTFDARAGVEAIVGPDWALTPDLWLQHVEVARPQPFAPGRADGATPDEGARQAA